LRAAEDSDRATLAAIYASTREEELASVPWTVEQKKAFTDWQSAQQEAHYALHYEGAERLLVEQGAATIGRIYVHTTRTEVRLMEMTLLPGWRNAGLGSRLMGVLLAYADGLRLPVSLHVEPFNPARRLYLRLGFEPREARGLYELMERPVPAS
jgi:GNAT superfamily N-acetyltransferase